jgi:hypothetical protein
MRGAGSNEDDEEVVGLRWLDLSCQNVVLSFIS